MKRAAEKQLVKDDDSGDEVEEVSETGFKKADEAVLAARPIRKLPKRGGQFAASGTPPLGTTTTSEPASTSRFAGFAGFGGSATSSAPFSFSQPPGAPKLSPAVPAASPFSLSSSSTTSPQLPSLFGPSVSSTASPATKAFASLVSASSAEPKAAAPPAADEDEREVDYYKALRGLNVSFLSAISKAIESDPFVDVAELLERYKSLRISVKSDFDTKSKESKSAPPFMPEAKATEAPKPAPPALTFSMPSAPTSFTGFKPSTSSTTSPTPASGGFVPKIDSGSTPSLGSPFSFAPSKPPSTESAFKPEAPKSAFSFGSTSAPSSNSNTNAPTSFFGSSSTAGATPFTFGAPAAPSTTGSLFSKPDSTSATSIFGGSTAPASTSSLGSAWSSTATTGLSSPPSLFGSSSTTTPLFGGPFGAKDKDTSATIATLDKDKPASSNPFSFGSASPGKQVSAFSFGAAKAGSIGNPVGFGFGSPPKTPDADTGSGPVKSLPFSFGPPKSTESKSESAEGEKDGSSAEGTPTTDAFGSGGDAPPPPLLAASSVHDQEGEGEQDEETVHEIRSKVYRMTKDKDGKPQWGDYGVGLLRLKKHKNTGARRVLMRNSNTGKVTINFLVHSGMNVTHADRAVSFIGHEDGASVPYRIRLKTADQAQELKSALNREIEFVKSKSDSGQVDLP